MDARPPAPDLQGLDGAPEDAGSDQSPPDFDRGDMGLVDAAPSPDLALPDAAPIFPFDPDPLCDPATAIEYDMPGGFERQPAPLGVASGVVDGDGDGLAEIFAVTANISQEVPREERDRAVFSTVYAWDGESAFADQGELVGFVPLAVARLEDAQPPTLVGAEHFLDPRNNALGMTIGVRADAPGAPLRYDLSVDRMLYVDGLGGLSTDYLAPFDVEVFDGDQDGRVEILTHTGDLLEWTGDGFAVTWQAAEADPRDPATEVGGGAFGRSSHGDFDGDGRLEFVINGASGLQSIDGGPARADLDHARVFENRGDDDYRLVARLPYGTANSQVGGAGDITGDGRPEFLVGGTLGACLRIEVWSAVADDTYVRLARIDHAARLGSPTNLGLAALGDLDGDGDDELVANVADAIVAWDWDGAALRQILGYPYCEDCTWNPVWVDDLDGDGVDEIVFSELTHAERAAFELLSPNGVRILRSPAARP